MFALAQGGQFVVFNLRTERIIVAILAVIICVRISSQKKQ